MGCTVDFSGITNIVYSCDELSTGGLKTVYLCDKNALDLISGGVTVDPATGQVTVVVGGLVTAGLDLVSLGFNNKDGFSNFTDVKTLNADGSG